MLIAYINARDMNRAAESEIGPSSKKRAADSLLENESAQSKKRDVTVGTVKKWILENDKEIATSTCTINPIVNMFLLLSAQCAIDRLVTTFGKGWY